MSLVNAYALVDNHPQSCTNLTCDIFMVYESVLSCLHSPPLSRNARLPVTDLYEVTRPVSREMTTIKANLGQLARQDGRY